MKTYIEINGVISLNDNKVSMKEIINSLKSGDQFIIEDELGNDVTRTLIVRHLFKNKIDWDYFSSIIDDDDLESMVFAGDFETWYIRRLMWEN